MSDLYQSRLHLVETFEEASAFQRWLGERRPILAIDTETTGLDWWAGDLRLIQLGDPMDGWVLPAKWWGGLAKQAIEAYEGPIAMQNAKFDVHWLREYDITVPRQRLHDTRIMAHLVDNLKPTGLKALSSRLVDTSANQLDHELKAAKQRHGWGWDTVPLHYPTYWQYAAMDVILTSRVAELLWDQVQPYRALYDVEMTTQQVLIDQEARGLRIDRAYCERESERMAQEIAQLTAKMTMKWHVENPNSDQQVAVAMEQDGVKFVQFTPTGQPSMEKTALQGVDHELAPMVTRLRHLTKIKGTYLDKFLEMADSQDILHPSINLLGARTGRMSVSDPPLQNLERSRQVRDAFIPREDHTLLLVDYDQIELRLLAHYAQVMSMLEAAQAGQNLHEAAARAIFGLGPEEDIPRRQYQKTKNAGFAKIYGAGLTTFAATAGIPEAEAARFMAEYDARFPEVNAFMAAVIAQGRRRSHDTGDAFVVTAYGRKLNCHPKKAYKLVNYLIQGTAADVLKTKIVACDAAGLLEHMVLPVHDEFVLDVPTSLVDELQPALEEAMTEAHKFSAPLTVSGDRYGRWGDKYEEDS